MYTQHFRLSEPPFSIAPNPRYLYLSPQHREALAHLLYGIGVGGGFVVLSGEVGTGKTTLCRALLDQLPEDVEIALIFNPRLNSRELLAGICDELHIPYSGPKASLKQLIDALNRHLLDAHARGRRVIVLIDEAQNLRFDVLEQVRLLTNLETNQTKLLQIILVGQPELNQILDRPNLRQLAQRITARYHLNPLSLTATRDYIRHRMTVAGGSERVFSGNAIRAIHRQARGIPRLINVIADRALLGAYTLGKLRVSAPTARRAGRELRTSARGRWGWWLACVLGLAAVGLAAAWRLNALPALLDRVADAITIESSPEQHPGEKPRAGSSADPAGAAKTPATAAQAPPESDQPATPPAPVFAEWIARSEFQRGGALSSLLALWSLTVPEGSADPCVWASTQGLRCQTLQGPWSRIGSLNLPAMLEFVTAGGERRYAALIRRHDRQLELANGNVSARFDLGDVLSLWTGAALTVWKPPMAESVKLRLGETAPIVGRIRQQLGLGATPGAENLYDEGLMTRIMEFQNAHGLKADGIVGAMTLFHLQAAGADSGIPRLMAASP